ncbi:MAG: MarR family winged helix-turn-helix transcriptional regulator [Paracoccaceae bacterium]
MNQPLESGTREKTNPEVSETLDLGQLSYSVGFLLRMAQVEIFEAFHTELGEYGLKPGEFSAFWLIGQHPMVRQGLVARSLSIKQAHMTKLVRGLEERGLITRVIPDNDRRSVLLNITKDGQEFLEKVQDKFLKLSHSENTTLSDAENKTLVSLLQKFTKIPKGTGL